MLFWSFVLAFVLGILYYTMYPRPDAITVVEKPQAETAVVAFLNAHQVAKELMYSMDDLIPVTVTNPDGSTTQKEGEYETPVIRMTYVNQMKNVPMTLTTSTSGVFDGLLPAEGAALGEDALKDLGYINQDIRNKRAYKFVKPNRRDEVFSAVACIKTIYETDPATGLPITDPISGLPVEKEKQLTFTCGTDTTDYVISIMNPDTASWIDNEKIARHELWRGALLHRTRGSYECGLLYPAAGSVSADGAGDLPAVTPAAQYDKNAKYVLDNSVRFTSSIPREITNKLEGKMGSDLTDMLFCITPIKDIKTTLDRRRNYEVID